ncbi:MAG: YceI family protein [Paracoccaceae bacterium]
MRLPLLRLISMVLAALVMTTLPAFAGKWMIDEDASFVLVDVAYFSGGKVSIRFNDVGGDIEFDDRRPEATRAKITVGTETAQSGLALLDPVVRGPRFLNAQAYPAITFDFDRLEQTGPSDADISGTIMIFGISRAFEMEAQVVRYRPDEPNPADRVISFNLFGEINRRDFGNTIQSGLIEPVLLIRIHLALRPVR